MTFASLEQMAGEVLRCTDCGLCRSRNMAVAGKGSYRSPIVFVGEAPGRSEDIRGEPFVGEAGRRLSAALQHAGISRESVYITNVVKCRPPGNRMPTDDEMDACRKYLDFEISAIRPKIICIMGNAAYGSLLGGGNITRDRGRIIRRSGRSYFLTVHPAATIYRPGLTDGFREDMAKLARIAGTME